MVALWKGVVIHIAKWNMAHGMVSIDSPGKDQCKDQTKKRLHVSEAKEQC